MDQELNSRGGDDDWDANVHYKDTLVAENYDAVRFSSFPGRIFNEKERRIILAAAASCVAKGATIADMPCGTGRLAEPLLEAGYRVHGMDISAEMLSVASQRLRRFGDAFSTEVADAKAINRSHNQYGAVLCARVLMHFLLEEQIEFLRGVARLTSGPVIINHSFSSPYQRLRRSAKRFLGHAPPARFPVTSRQLGELLSKAGLEEVRRYRLSSLISEAIYIVARPASKSVR
jgi:2-polyprenyl-3-methyl-5-hydroxy-6-metoxy-1,4-benzoquinol methylase